MEEEKANDTQPESKKQKFRRRLIYAFVLLASILITFFVTSHYYKKTGLGELSQLNLPSSQMQSVNEAFRALESGYFGDVENESLVDGAISGMADAIEDPYTEYYPKDERDELDAATTGSFEGIGAEVIKEGDYVKVVAPLAESPAEKAGIQPNDLIIAVDGKSTSGLNLNDVVSKIRGEKGSQVTIRIRRGEQESDLTVVRDSIPIETVTYKKDESNNQVGYVEIRSFSQPTYQDLVEAIQDLEHQGVEKIIFDVRKNPGGLLDASVAISNIFLEDGERIMSVEDNNGGVQEFLAGKEYGDFKYEGEAVLLVDEGSASASEILAGAMQSAGIPIIGSPTFGKGTVQTVLELENEGELKFTTARWLTASGEWINEKGIQPDQKVDMPDYAHLLWIDSSQSYQEGQQSKEVKNINAILKALDYDVPQDDVYSASTRAAVEDFQKQHQLPINGQVSGETATQLSKSMSEKIKANDRQYEAGLKVLTQ